MQATTYDTDYDTATAAPYPPPAATAPAASAPAATAPAATAPTANQLVEEIRRLDPTLLQRLLQRLPPQVRSLPTQVRERVRQVQLPRGRGPQAVFAPGDARLAASGRVPPIVTKAGKQAYEVTFKKGMIHGKGSNVHCNLAPRQFFPAEQCRFSFKVWFDDNFPWGTDMKKVGGKLLGLIIGTGDASGGEYSPTGASFRMTWNYNGGVGPYLYPQVRSGFDKGGRGGQNISWDLLDQSDEVKAVSTVATGVHVFYPKDRKDPDSWELRLRKGGWNEVEMFCRLNTPGRKDGTLEVTVNGTTKRLTSVRFRNDSAAIEGVKIHSFFGGATKDYAPPQDTRMWYADFGFSRA